MIRKVLFLIAALSVLLYGKIALGATVSLEQAITQANQEIGFQYYVNSYSILINNIPTVKELNRDIWDERGFLVYGGPDAVEKSEQDYKQGHYRFLGYTKTGDLFPDPDFPPDHGATTLINHWNWYEEPWISKTPLFCMLWDGLYDNRPDYEPYLVASLQEKFGHDKTLFDPQVLPRTNEGGTAAGWYRAAKILQPRTSVTPGLGRLWHNWNNAPWYITVVIPAQLPKTCDIEAVAINRTSPVHTGTRQVSQAVFANNGDEAAEFTAEYYACGKKAGTERLRIEAKQSKTTSFTWTSPAKAGTYTLKIQALPVEGESNTDNNSKIVNVAVKSPNYCKPDCTFASKYGENWDETYTWQIRHSDTCTGKDGQEYDCSWTETCSETVAYSESLEAILTVNTKQGIPTDRQNPRESDRESRGSWEIIPYARANGLDPNEVTRAGYGFEVKVQTTYKTDWETKVPGPADPHGGAYRGPYKVIAQFYDTTMTEVEEIELEATSGKPGDRAITWEIPLSRFDFSDGSYVWVRKHYTDVRNKDGRYAVRVIVEPCGRGQLSICRDKYIMIYGDMYDDIYTRPSTAEEW